MLVETGTFVSLLLISSLLTFIASLIAWKRSVPGSFALSLLLMAMVIWAGSYAIYLMPIPLSLKTFLPNITYVGVTSIPTLFLIFTLSFTHQGIRFTRRIQSLLAIEPVLTILLLWTNQYHSLVFLSGNTISQNMVPVIELAHGPWYFVNIFYSYAVILAGILTLLYGMLRASPLHKGQYLTIIFASLIPWCMNIYIEYIGLAQDVDWTPVMFGLSSTLLNYSVVRKRFMDIIPVARSRLIENMSDGVLVLDTQNRIVDINPAMEHLLGHKPASHMGMNASEFLNTWMDQTEDLLGNEKTRIELRLPNSPSRYLDLRVTPLYTPRGHLSGRLIVFRDVTERKQVEKQLRLANERLQSQLIEINMLQSKLRAQAIRDPLTSLFNRRYLDETLDREIERAARESYPVCVIMMDLDHFKKVNDTYGHEAGDEVLKALARTLTSCNRRGDFACRFGGEEFVVVMPNIAVDIAYQRAEKLRQTLNSLQIQYGKFILNATISIGIACYPSNGDERETILRAADRAMYAAKKAGRNHILTYDNLETHDHAVHG